MSEFTPEQQELARLYVTSDTLKFGAFKLSIHEKDPTLPLSPVYMHYPKDGEPGAEQLPRIYELAGVCFAQIVSEQNLDFDRIAGVPNGANPLAVEVAKLIPDGETKLVTFSKHIDDEGKRAYEGPTDGVYEQGDSLALVEDHTSGGYNKSIFIEAAAKSGLTVTDILTVVDREQGAEAYLRSVGVAFYSIFKLSELLDFYVSEGTIDAAKRDETNEYIRNNQIKVGE